MMISCENDRCVYWQRGRCLLHTIALDRNGMCTDGMEVEIDSVLFERARNDMRERFGIAQSNADAEKEDE